LGGDPKDLEADVLRRAALLLLEYDKGRLERRHGVAGTRATRARGAWTRRKKRKKRRPEERARR
jgi:hypothetical protein